MVERTGTKIRGSIKEVKDSSFWEDIKFAESLRPGSLPKQRRRWIIKNESFEFEGKVVAAIEIQRRWRGFRVRQKVKALCERLLNRDPTPVSSQLSVHSGQRQAEPVDWDLKLALQLGSVSYHPGVEKKKSEDRRRSSQLLKVRKVHRTKSPASYSLEAREECEPQGPGVEKKKSEDRRKSSQLLKVREVHRTKSPASYSLEAREEREPQGPQTEPERSVKPEKSVKPERSEKPERSVSHRDHKLSHVFHQRPFVLVTWNRAHHWKLAERELRLAHTRLLAAKRRRDVKEGESTADVCATCGLPVGIATSEKRRKMTKKSAPRLALEGSYDRYVQKALERGETSTNMMQFMEYCAYRVQIWWLMKHHTFLRERFIQRLIDLQNKAAMDSAAVMEAMIQESTKTVKKKKREGPLAEKEAAISIQRAWRRHIDIQVYCYYRDLINFKTRGNPAVMLRCINPNESRFMDAASGTSVRFRLAGDRFPPNIYYKIFTHRPVQDMCANSPKDYTKAQAKQLNVKHRHNKVATIPPQQDDKTGWYQRIENNGWRLVSDRLIHHIMNDPITWESSRKTYHFDHSKLKRKQDVEKQKKSKKIEWMKKMYKQGMLRARADDQETVQLIEGAAAGMMATVDNQGPDALEDWEVNELLDWTTSLNFEEYFSTWKDLATSAAADNQLEKTMSIGTSKSDPYELTVSTAPSRFQSTRQSRHTTATLTSGSIHVKT